MGVKEYEEIEIGAEKYTKVLREVDFEYNAPNVYKVSKSDDQYLKDVQIINFQSGPIKESGVNGVMNEDLIAMVIDRLEHFQQSEFRCRENSLAITKLEESLHWLGYRTNKREKRGVEGTHKV